MRYKSFISSKFTQNRETAVQIKSEYDEMGWFIVLFSYFFAARCWWCLETAERQCDDVRRWLKWDRVHSMGCATVDENYLLTDSEIKANAFSSFQIQINVSIHNSVTSTPPPSLSSSWVLVKYDCKWVTCVVKHLLVIISQQQEHRDDNHPLTARHKIILYCFNYEFNLTELLA